MKKIYSDCNLTINSPLSQREYRRLLRALKTTIETPDGSRVSFCVQGSGCYPVGIECEHTDWYAELVENADDKTFHDTLNHKRGSAAHFAVRRLMTRIGRTFDYSL